MATKAELESKLEECRRMNRELQAQCNEWDHENESLRSKLAESRQHAEDARDARESRLRALEELSKVSAELQQAKQDLELTRRNLRDEESVVKQIRFICTHRIKVTHDCDVGTEWIVSESGESSPVPVSEDVRFLREIVRLCKSNELPF